MLKKLKPYNRDLLVVTLALFTLVLLTTYKHLLTYQRQTITFNYYNLNVHPLCFEEMPFGRQNSNPYLVNFLYCQRSSEYSLADRTLKLAAPNIRSILPTADIRFDKKIPGIVVTQVVGYFEDHIDEEVTSQIEYEIDRALRQLLIEAEYLTTGHFSIMPSSVKQYLSIKISRILLIIT